MRSNLSILCATAVVLVLAAGTAVSPARAHFILRKPASWTEQDPTEFAGGAPQKGGPCGPGGNDDVTPVPTTGESTTVRAGDTLTVEWQTTVPHLGYFRIALAKDRADFVDPKFTDPVQCSYDMAAVPTGPHGNVLMDGIAFSATSQDVTIPDEPCEKCTLQVMQVMQDHGPPECIYYHCADLKILPREGGGAGAGADAGAKPPTSRDGGRTDSGDGAEESSGDDDDGGCAVVTPGTSRSGIALASVLGAIAALTWRRRRRA